MCTDYWGDSMMELETQPAARRKTLADIPIVVAKDKVQTTTRGVAPPPRSTAKPYRAYKPQPFTSEQRRDTTVLFGGLHWRVERVIQGAMENLGYRTQVLPTATRQDLLAGREVADI